MYLLQSKPHDLCIEMKLFAADGSVLRICRTSVKHHVIDTEFNEMFMFRLTEERLKNVTLQVSCVTLRESCVTLRVSCVTFRVNCVTLLVSCVTLRVNCVTLRVGYIIFRVSFVTTTTTTTALFRPQMLKIIIVHSRFTQLQNKEDHGHPKIAGASRVK